MNYRNFENSYFLFNKGINTIIGENASGKTNLFRAIRLILDDNLLSYAYKLNENDFNRNLINWKGRWIIISLEFSEISNEEAIQALFVYGSGVIADDKVKKATYNLFFRPKPEIRKQSYDLEIDSSVIIVNNTMISNVCNIIENLQKENPDIQPDDIAIILIDDNKEIYTYIDKLCLAINKVFGWSVSRGYESKETVANHLYITNPNNVKGLEFPYVICITHRIMDSYRYRNTLYTMLTRSFLQSFLLVTQNDKLDVFSGGLNIINSDLYIETSIPTEEQKDKMKQTLLKYQEEESSLSYKDFIEAIFIEQGIVDEKVKEALLTALSKTTFDRFDKEQTVQFIDINKKFY